MITNSSYFEHLSQSLSGGVHYNFRTNGNEHLSFIKNASRSRVWDIEGNEYLDLYAKFGAMIVGHSNEYYNEYLKSQIDKVLSINHSDLDLEACELIKRQFPGMEQMRFCLSGTEAVQNALRLARAYTGKQRFVRVESHYHGNSDNIMGGKIDDSGSPYPVEYKADPRGTEGRAKDVFQNQSLMVKWNDIATTEAVIYQYHEEIAAFIMEPVLINGGGIAPDLVYLKTVRDLCTRYNIVLIYDEIITGLRVSQGGAQHVYQVFPDLTVLGKSISGGVPVSVIGGKRELMQLYADRRVIHAGTFNGYPLGMASIIATLNILSRDEFGFYARAERYLEQIARVMEEECRRNGIEFSMSVFGSVGVYNCQTKAIFTPEDIDYFTVLKSSIFFRTLPKFGILVSPISRLFVNYQFDDRDMDFFCERIGSAVKQCGIEIEKVLGGSLRSVA